MIPSPLAPRVMPLGVSFDNAGIAPPRWNKPHVVWRDGYWRVSKMHGYCHSHKSPLGLTAWHKAHALADVWNRNRTKENPYGYRDHPKARPNVDETAHATDS